MERGSKALRGRCRESDGNPRSNGHDTAPASHARATMSKSQQRMTAGLTTGERDYIRRELDRYFTTLPSVAEGIQVKVWRTGSRIGQPKLPPPAQSLVERGLMRLDSTRRPPRLFFTDVGLATLRTMMADRRLADPERFAHIQRELGIDPTDDAVSSPLQAGGASGGLCQPTSTGRSDGLRKEVRGDAADRIRK